MYLAERLYYVDGGVYKEDVHILDFCLDGNGILCAIYKQDNGMINKDHASMFIIREEVKERKTNAKSK